MIFRFVRQPRALDYVRLGWLPLPDLYGTNHGVWSVLMRWSPCDCGREMREPR
jgi:hypothetical protein